MRCQPWNALTLAALLAAPAMSTSIAFADPPAEQLAAASALYDAGKYADAASKLDAFLAANPKHPRAGAAWFTLARCRVELGQFDKAVPAYEKAVASKDATILSLAQLGLGEAAIQTKQYDKAVSALTEAVKGELKPAQAPVVWFWLGQARFETKQYAGAEEAFGKIAKDFPRSDVAGEAWFGAGLAALRQKKNDAARTGFRAVIDRYPRSESRPRALLLLAQMDFQEKKWGEARTGFERLLTDASFNVPASADVRPAAQDGLIQTLLELKEYDRAGDLLEAAIQRLKPEDPERFRALLSLGHCRTRQKRLSDARSAYFKAAAAKEDDVAGEALYWAGNAFLAENMPVEAALQFRRMAAEHPKHKLAVKSELRAAQAYESAKQEEKAAATYQELLDKFPSAPEAAEARTALTGLSDGISDPVKLLATLKNTPPEQQARGTLRAVRLYVQAKQYPQALSTLETLKKANPPALLAAEALYLTGVVNDLTDKPQAAADALTQAVKIASTDAAWLTDAHARLAYLMVDLKKPAEAETFARAALSRNPAPALARQARLNLMQAQLDQKKWDAALETGNAVLADSPSAEAKETVLYTQAWVAGQKGKPEDALPLWERLLAEQPKSRYAAEALIAVADIRAETAAKDEKDGKADDARKKYEEAEQKYAQAVTDFPQSPLAAEARFKRGSVLYNAGKFSEAAEGFDAAAKEKSAGEYLPEALYWAGLAYEKAGKKSEAATRLTRLVTEFPASKRVERAKIRLAALKAVQNP